ncbi:MAG: undecaprenyldiphospho-muramoylpentapeptide beta-N-acetylglucosaminyltransferase [Thermodesulfobacteriota bacterium]
MRLLIAGGGTGGHLFPGVAVAEELLARGPEHAVLFAGTARGLEARVLPPLGLPFATVRAAGLVGAGLGKVFRALGLLALGLGDAAQILRRFRPTACLGVGGYVSFPVVALARLRGVPTAVQEQNAWPGVANRTLARVVRRVYAGDPAAARHLPRAKTRVTGNPLRRSVATPLPYAPPAAGEPARLLILGGSQGARFLNEVVPAALATLGLPAAVWHQAGRGRAEGAARAYGEREGVRVVEFIDDMAAAYGWAQLVIARAGALTVAELASAGRPAVLVPFPHAAGGHQEANARAAEARGAAITVLEAGLAPEALAGRLRGLLGGPATLAAMAAAAAASARRDAAREIVDDLLEMERGEG